MYIPTGKVIFLLSLSSKVIIKKKRFESKNVHCGVISSSKITAIFFAIDKLQ